MIVIGKTTKGYWPAPIKDQIVGYPSHPFGFKMNSDYIVGLARTYEERYGVKFEGMRDGAVTDPRERLLQFKTNIDVALSVLDNNGLGDWLADRLVEHGRRGDGQDARCASTSTRDPFLDDRLRVANLPEEPQKVTVTNAVSGKEKTVSIALFKKPGEAAGARRGDFRNHQVAELRDRQPHAERRGGPLGVGQPRAWRAVGTLRSRTRTRSARD